MASQAAVHNLSPERSDSSQSNTANENEPNYRRISSNHGDLHFPSARPDASLHRASTRSFDDHLATLQSPSEPEPSVTTELNYGTSRSSQPAPTIDGLGEPSMIQNHLPDGVDHETSRSIRDPFPEQTASSTTPAHPTSPTSIYPDDGLLQPWSTSTHPNNAAPQPTSATTPPASDLPSSTQSPPLPAPIPAFHVQRATPPPLLSTQPASIPPTQQAPSSSVPPLTTTPSHPSQTIQPTTSPTSQIQNHRPNNPRDRRRRRFARWVRRRFGRQLPWLEGWIHGRAGSERREASRAIRAAEEAGFR